MKEVTSRVLRRLGFERVGERSAERSFDIDLSGSVKLGVAGQAHVPLHNVIDTDKFKRQLEVLGEIAQAYRDSTGAR